MFAGPAGGSEGGGVGETGREVGDKPVELCNADQQPVYSLV